MQLFLDANAHIPLSKKAKEAHNNFLNSVANHGHPSALNVPGRQAAEAIENSRRKIAELLGANSANQIIFTSGCTQAAEWGMQILSNFGGRVAISPIEHSAVSQAAKKYISNLTNLQVNSHGEIQSNDSYDVIISTYLQNEIGVIQETYHHTDKLFLDASQSVGKIPFNLKNFHNNQTDIAIFSAHKFGGPASIGILYLKNPNEWQSFGTGSRYFMDRAGTPDTIGIVTTAAALEEAIETLPNRTRKMVQFQSYLESELQKLHLHIIGFEAKNRSPNTTFVAIPNKAPEILLKLSEIGIHVGFGSACGSIYSGNSPTLSALGYDYSNQDCLRISQFGEYGLEEVKYFVKKLKELL